MKKNTSNIFSLGRIFADYFLLFIAIAFAGVAIYFFFLFTTASFAEATETVSPPNYKGAVIAVLVSSMLMLILFFWFKNYIEKRARKDNIGKLSLLIRMLFNSFNNLLKEDGLLEEMWKNSSSAKDKLVSEKFWSKLVHTRKIMREELTEDSLIDFESLACYIQPKNSKASIAIITDCEKEGLRILECLLGSNLAKMELEELKHALRRVVFNYSLFYDDDLREEILEKLSDNLVDVSPFKRQLDQIREFSSNQEKGSRKTQGLLQEINDLSNLHKLTYECSLEKLNN